MPLRCVPKKTGSPRRRLRRFLGESAKLRRLDVARCPLGFESLSERITPATFTIANSTQLQITLDSSEEVTLTTIGSGDSTDGSVLTLSSTTFSGTDDSGTVTGDGTDTLSFANDGSTITSVSITGGGSNTFDLSTTVGDFDAALTINLTSGTAITNSGDFAFAETNTLSVTADGTSVTQSGSLSLNGTAFFNLGSTGDLTLATSLDTNGSTISITNADDVTIIDTDSTGSGTTVSGVLVNGDLSVTNAGSAAGDLSVTVNEVVGTLDANISDAAGGNVSVSVQEAGSITAVNSSDGSGAGITVATTSGDLTISGITQTDSTGTVTLTSNANIYQSGTIDTNGAGVTATSSTGVDIDLSNDFNDFGGGTFTLGGDVADLLLTTETALVLDGGGNTISGDLALIAGTSITADSSGFSVSGAALVRATDDIALTDSSIDLTTLNLQQADSSSSVSVSDASGLTVWGDIAGSLTLDVTDDLILGSGGSFTLGSEGGTITGSTISVVNTTVDLGSGSTTLDVTISSTPVEVTSELGAEAVLTVDSDGTVTIANGIDLDAGSVLGGLGTFDVSSSDTGIVVGSSALVAPVTGSTVGTLSITGDLSFDSDGLFGVELQGSSSFTSVDASGTVDITDADLLIEFDTSSYIPGVGDSFTILTAGSVTGLFANLDSSDRIVANGVTFQVATNSSSTSVTLTVVANAADVDGIGLYRPDTAEFIFNTSDPINSFDASEYFTITFGNADENGFVGDFTGDGSVNIGIRRGEQFIINTSPIFNFDASSFVTVTVGLSTDIPLIGDWDGDGDDDLGLYRADLATYVTINMPTITTGETGDLTDSLGTVRNITFGNPPDSGTDPYTVAAVGYFDDEFTADQIGIMSDGTLDMADVDIASLSAGNSSITAFFQPDPTVFGTTDDQPLNGYWISNSTGIDQRGIFRGSSATFSLSTSTSSTSSVDLVFGLDGDIGIHGRWISLSSSTSSVESATLATSEGLLDAFFADDEEL
ncbi:hypothetical protein Pan216_33860 [Planctomycetes bacterium Pan216]|uniref:Uncharacterized protein n=1 Tax=Kolteria novifilia TaxID=2527975 RepID=A0A518B6B9_9BACT|nr:hypothetical protein Pan216_33860 [Planctomycetes bacterium Pan216]